MPGMYAPPAVELPKTSAIVGMPAADSRVRSRKICPPGMKISFCVGRSAPPDSTRPITGSRFCERDLVGAQGLLQRPRVGRAAAHGRVVGDDQALDALDDADAGDDARADVEVGAPGGERRQLEERRVGVEQQLDALAGEQLAALVVPLDVLRAAAGERLGVLGVELGELGEHRLAVRRRVTGRRVGSSASSAEDRSSARCLRDVEVAGAEPLAERLGLRVEAARSTATPSPRSPSTTKLSARRLGSTCRSTGSAAVSGSSSRKRSTVERRGRATRRPSSVRDPDADVGVAALVAAARAGDGPSGTPPGRARRRAARQRPVRAAGASSVVSRRRGDRRRAVPSGSTATCGTSAAGT